MTQDEFTQLSSTIQMLGRFKGLPDNSWMEATLYRLQSTFNIDNTNPSWVRFSQNEELEGLRYFSRLFEAISKGIVLRIDYHKFGTDSWSREIHPYQLRQYNNRWFLVGYEENQSKGLPLVVLPLDRSLYLIPNYEFETIMLTYADNCEILEPSSLRDNIYHPARPEGTDYKCPICNN